MAQKRLTRGIIIGSSFTGSTSFPENSALWNKHGRSTEAVLKTPCRPSHRLVEHRDEPLEQPPDCRYYEYSPEGQPAPNDPRELPPSFSEHAIRFALVESM